MEGSLFGVEKEAGGPWLRKCFGGEVGDSMLTAGREALGVPLNIDMGRCLGGVGCLFLSWVCWSTCSVDRLGSPMVVPVPIKLMGRETSNEARAAVNAALDDVVGVEWSVSPVG